MNTGKERVAITCLGTSRLGEIKSLGSDMLSSKGSLNWIFKSGIQRTLCNNRF